MGAVRAAFATAHVTSCRGSPPPYPLSLPQRAGLADCDPDMWRRVHDFNWHRVQQSPNWAELPEAERAVSVRDPELAVAGGEGDGVVVRAPGGGPGMSEADTGAESSDEEL